MNYGSAEGLFGRGIEAASGIEHAAESIEETVVESTPIDVGHVPVPDVVDKAGDMTSKAKAVAEGAKAKVAEHVEKAKQALESAGVAAMIAALYAKLTAKRFHGVHMIIAIIITIFVVVVFNMVFPSVSKSVSAADVEDMVLTVPSAALVKQPVSVAAFLPSRSGVRIFHV